LNEEWKWVNGFEGVYQISNFGRLKSYKKYKDGYILSNTNQKGGYLSVVLTNKAVKLRRCTRIHVLVAEHFIGEIPKGYHVDHIDGNKQNNIVTNLQILHPKAHRAKTEIEHPQIVDRLRNYNMFERPRHIQQYDLDGHFIAEYANAQIASDFTGVCQRNIMQVANKEEYVKGKVRKQAGGFVWKLKESEVV
jgi:hypothetical protein